MYLANQTRTEKVYFAPGAPPAACLFLSRFFGRRFGYPHFLQWSALIEFVALQFMQTFFIKRLASASGNLAILIAGFLEDMRCI